MSKLIKQLISSINDLTRAVIQLEKTVQHLHKMNTHQSRSKLVDPLYTDSEIEYMAESIRDRQNAGMINVFSH